MRVRMNNRSRFTRSLKMVGVAGAMVAGFLSLPVGAASAAPTAAPKIATPAAGVFTALANPARVCDTRISTTGCTAGTVAAGGTLIVPLAGVPANATAAVVNVTAAGPAGQGFLSVYPTGTAPAAASTSVVNYTNGQNVANQATVEIGTTTGGAAAVSIANGPATGTGGPTDVVVDLQGYYAPAAAGSGNAGQYTTLPSPGRIADSRCFNSTQTFCSAENLPPVNAGVQTIGAGGTANIQATNVAGIPATNVSDVVLNVTEVNATTPSFFTVYGTGQAQPATSNLNFAAGEVLSARVIAPVGTGGDVTVFNHAGTADVVVDAVGYFASSGGVSGALFTPIAPVRVIGSSTSGTTVAAGASTDAAIVGSNGVPAGATAAALNVTDITPSFGNFLTVFASDIHPPVVSDVNFVPANTYNVVPNAAYGSLSLTTGGTNSITAPIGSVSVLNGPANTNNNAGPAQVDADLYGYFSPSNSGPPVNGVSVSLGATPASILANGTSTSALVATVTGLNGPVSGDSVTFSTNGTGCGTINPTSGSSTSAGTVSATYTSSTIVGNCNVTASEATQGAASNVVVITQTAPVASTTFKTFVSAVPSTVNTTAPGNTSVITVTVQGAGNSPINADQVGIQAIGTGCGTFPPLGNQSISQTGPNGQATFNYTSGSTVGTCTIGAKEANQGTVGAATVTQILQGYSTTVVANPPNVVSNGLATSTITASVLHNGAAANGDSVTFVVGNPQPVGTCGTVQPGPVTTVNGHASVTYTAPNIPNTAPNTSGFCTVTAMEALGGTTGPVVVTNTAQASTATAITVSANPTSVAANGGTSTVTATVTGASSTGITGDSVEFTFTGTACGANGSPQYALTGAGGLTPAITFTSTNPGTCTVNVVEANANQTASTPITVTPVVYAITVAANPSALTGNGVTTSQLTATVLNESGAPVGGDIVTFSLLAPLGAGCGTLPNGGVVQTNASGQATINYTSSTASGFCVVTANEATTNQNATTIIDQTSI
jgi:hypothetical protein